MREKETFMRKNRNNLTETTSSTTENNAIATLTGANLGTMLSSLGYDYQTTEKDKNGATSIVLKDAESGGTFEQGIVLKQEEFTALATLRELQNFDTMKRIVVAWKCYELKSFAKNNGFKSVGELVEMNVKGLSALTVNQYARVAELFLELPEGADVPVFRYDWCKGVSITNLVQSLSLIKKCDNDIDKFYTEYIESDKLHLRSTLATLKGELDTINGKSKSKSKSKSESESESENKVSHPVMSYATMYASLSEKLLAQEGCPDAVINALGTIAHYMSEVGLIVATTTTTETAETTEE